MERHGRSARVARGKPEPRCRWRSRRWPVEVTQERAGDEDTENAESIRGRSRLPRPSVERRRCRRPPAAAIELIGPRDVDVDAVSSPI